MTQTSGLTSLVDAINQAPVTVTIKRTVSSPVGVAAIALADLAPSQARSIQVSHVKAGSPSVGVSWQVEDDALHLELRSQGVHFTPQPWDALRDPVEVTIAASYLRPAISAEQAPDIRPYSTVLPAGLEHIVKHDMASTRFIERVVSLDGSQQFAMIDAIDGNQLRVTLTEAIPVRLDVVFLPEPEGDA